MNVLAPIETTLAALYARAPHLPEKGRRWLGANTWWIVLILAILSVFSALGDLGQLLQSVAHTGYVSLHLISNHGAWIAENSVALAVAVVAAILFFSAVAPLKDRRKVGWNLVLIEQLLGIASAVVTVILTSIAAAGSVFGASVVVGFVIGLVVTAVYLYFLFEVRREFGSRAAEAVKAAVVPRRRTSAKK